MIKMNTINRSDVKLNLPITDDFSDLPAFDALLDVYDESETFSRDGKHFQIFIMPVVLSLPATVCTQDLDELGALPALGNIIRQLPPFKDRAVEIAPRLIAGNPYLLNHTYTSIDFARSGDWSTIHSEPRRDDDIYNNDIFILDRQVCVRHIYIRVAGHEPLRINQIEFSAEMENRLSQMIRFSIDNSAHATKSSALVFSTGVNIMPIIPFIRAIYSYDRIRNCAILSHIASASAFAAGGKQPMGYQLISNALGKPRIKVFALKQGDEWRFEAELDNTFLETLDPQRAGATAKEMLMAAAAQFRLELVNLDATKMPH